MTGFHEHLRVAYHKAARMAIPVMLVFFACFFCACLRATDAALEPVPYGTQPTPCAFIINASNPEVSDAFLEKQYREQYGNRSEIPLFESIKIFNEEMKCYPESARFSPLTMDEVVGAINRRKETDFSIKGRKDDAILDAIVVDRVMPKGSTIRLRNSLEMAVNGSGSGETTGGLRIYLELGLDSKPDIGGSKLDYDQMVLIR